MIYLQLFWAFFKTGLFAVGGGLATLPFLAKISEQYGWFTQAELADMIAVAESTPGPIGVNMATYAGIHAAGIPGGIIATFALILPAFIIMLIIASLLTRFSENSYVKSVMATLRPVSVGLIAAAVYSVLKVALLDAAVLEQSSGWTFDCIRIPAVILFVVLFLARLKWNKLHPIVFIAVGAAVGILLQM